MVASCLSVNDMYQDINKNQMYIKMYTSFVYFILAKLASRRRPTVWFERAEASGEDVASFLS